MFRIPGIPEFKIEAITSSEAGVAFCIYYYETI